MSLLAIDNLQQLCELLPESVANEHCVVVTECSGDSIEIAHPNSGWDQENKKIIEYVLNRKLTWYPYPHDEIEKAIRIAYGAIKPVDNCSWKFAFECPKTWESLEKTEDDSIRNCLKCNKQVHLCFSESQVIEHAKRGQCICLVNWFSGEAIGDVIILSESEIAELDHKSIWPACPKCGAATQTKFGKQCFDCGHTWH